MNLFSLAIMACAAFAAEDVFSISRSTIDHDGFLVHQVTSPFQSAATQIRVLLPAAVISGQKFPAIYVLPVEAGNESRYGNALLEVKKHGLNDKAIFIAPTFAQLPWYADHPTDPAIRQESHFLQVVVPFVEKTYPVQPSPAGRLLLGFSKSGWGAWSLLLRHPQTFGRAAAWDAPLMLDRPGKYGTAPVFGTPDNFEQYKITSLLRAASKTLGPEPRLILTGYGNFRSEHQQTHALLNELAIPHLYRDGPQRKHDWHSGWLPEAVDLLLMK